jgi:hypothetical protein
VYKRFAVIDSCANKPTPSLFVYPPPPPPPRWARPLPPNRSGTKEMLPLLSSHYSSSALTKCPIEGRETSSHTLQATS